MCIEFQLSTIDKGGRNNLMDRTKLILAIILGILLSLASLGDTKILAETATKPEAKPILTTEKTLAKSETKAENFTLEDQFGNKIGIKFPSNKVVILVFGDRKGSEQVEGWVRPLYEKYTDQVYIFGIAELSVVPWAVRPVVRTMIRSKSKTPVMLDWTGKVAKSYGCEKGKSNVFVVNKEGHVIEVKRGSANANALNSLYSVINSAL
jgi:hypothetical protein